MSDTTKNKEELASCKVNEDALIDEEVIQIGAGRSGTTVVWQILNCIYKKVWKTHSPKADILKNPNQKIFFTYRDPRDLTISFARTNIFRKPKTPRSFRKGDLIPTDPTESFHLEFEKKASDSESFPQLDYAIFLAYREVIDGLIYKDGRKKISFGPFSSVQKKIDEFLKSKFKDRIKYEDYLGEEERIAQLVDDICKFSNIEIPLEKKEYISNKCNRKSNLLIQKRCADFKKVDKDSGIHGNHIKSNAKATWRTILSKEQIKHVNEVFKEELEHFDYE